VRDHHVAKRSGAFVEGGPLLNRQGLGDVNLNVLEMIAIPQRLEETVEGSLSVSGYR